MRIKLLFIAAIVLVTLAPMAMSEASVNAAPEDLQWWSQARFGMFIHWGPVCIEGTEIGWSRKGKRGDRKGTGTVPVEIYDNLYKQFNPVKYNAKEWVDIAKKTGMKYMVLTTKHHDGFAMFDSKYTDYDIMSSPFKRDIVGEYARACHEGGLKLGFYYSQPDWHHPDYKTERHDKYIKYLHNQVRELCTNYGKVSIIWFDGLGNKAKTWDAEKLYKMIRELQPGIIINNRAGIKGDFVTPEQRVGSFQLDPPWETCMTIGRQWAYRPNDKAKSLKRCIQVLTSCAGGNGNLLFNVGPTPEGIFDPPHTERLLQMGKWMEKYGETIYNTRGGPYMPGAWGVCTNKGNSVYLHLYDFDKRNGKITLPGLPAKIKSIKCLSGGTPCFKQTNKTIAISLPVENCDPINTIIELVLDKPASSIKPIDTMARSLAVGKQAIASNVFQFNHDTFGANKAIDGNGSTRWATDAGTSRARLEIDLKKPAVFSSVMIKEGYGHRIRKFELQYKQNDGEWKTFHKGRRTSGEPIRGFGKIEARYVRLEILNASDGPTIWEFGLFD
jgi:alpha-L-fucosidase